MNLYFENSTVGYMFYMFLLRVIFEDPSGRQKSPATRSKGLAKKWQSHQAQAVGIMDHRFMK